MTPSELERARKLATDMLMERLADDALDLDEFERRLDQVNAAPSVEAIAALLGEVAAAQPLARIPRVRPRGSPSPSDLGIPALTRRGRKRLRRLGRGNSVVVALQDGSGRVGPWTPARHVWVVNMLGGAVMDFREADLGPGVTELTVFCILGDVEIVLPLDLQVEFGGFGLIGGFDSEPTVGVSDPDAPILRINGISCLGGVKVSVKDLGEDVHPPRRVPRSRAVLREPRRESAAGASVPTPTPEKP